MDQMYSKYVRCEKMHSRFWTAKLEERNYLEELGLDGRILQRWVPKNRVWLYVLNSCST